MSDIDDSLTLGLRVLATLARRGPLDTARIARLNGWHPAYAAALVSVLEEQGFVRRIDDSARVIVTPHAVAVIGEKSPIGRLH